MRREVVYPFITSKGMVYIHVPGNGNLTHQDAERLQAMIAELVIPSKEATE